MHLYHLTLQQGSGITHAVHGSFSGTHEEILICKGKSLELFRLNTTTGKLHSLLTVDIFGIVRSMLAFFLTTKGTDSGKMVILEYNPIKNILESVCEDKFGKTGCRRMVPGQHLAVDPKGRAILVGAIERQRFLYLVGQSHDNRISVLHPIEEHEENTLIYHMIGLDVGYDNPLFAVLEVNCHEADNDATGEAAQNIIQTLTFYEKTFQQSLTIKHTEPLDEHANLLIPVPGGNDGPGGVLVCSENYLTYTNLTDQHIIRCPIPRRKYDLDDPERGMLIICYTTHKINSTYFILIQSEKGDLFKVTLETLNRTASEIKIKYYDTVPVATTICALKAGFLFVASEFGNHHLYQMTNLVEDDEPEFSSADPLEDGDTFYFAPRQLKNLSIVDEIESHSPIMNSLITNLANEENPQFYLVCGRGPRSSLRVLRHGLEVSEMVSSVLPASPNAVWTLKLNSCDEFDAYIIVSFPTVTLVLSIGETIQEVSETGFLSSTTTLACSSLGIDSLVQIFPNGVRQIYADKNFKDWKVSGKRQILKCAANQHQVIVALTGGDLVYFELDLSGILRECQQRKHSFTPLEVVSLALGNFSDKSKVFAIGLSDNSVGIMSLDSVDCFTLLNKLAVPALPTSLCITEMGALSHFLYLNIGLSNGTLLKMALNQNNWELTESFTRQLGIKPVKLLPASIRGSQGVIAISCRTWLSYFSQNRFQLVPLSYKPLEYASWFTSERCYEGIIAISTDSLHIIALNKLDTVFNQIGYQLQYTPRAISVLPSTGHLITIETEHKCYTEDKKNEMRLQMAKELEECVHESDLELAKQLSNDFLQENLPDSIFGSPKAGNAMWASLVRILNPVSGESHAISRLEENESATCLTVVQFANHPEFFIIVGAAKDYQLSPRQISGGSLYVFRVSEDHVLEFLHKTPINELPTALCGYHGKLLVGAGKCLRLYDVGKKKLLRKCENKRIPNLIVRIEVTGKRIYVSDAQESVFLLRYKVSDNKLVIFADDTIPRWITTTAIIDYNTVAIADKFGNIAFNRLSNVISGDSDEDELDDKSIWDRSLLNGTCHKVDFVAVFHVGEFITSIQKVSLISGAADSIVYTTISGSIGILVPFASHEEEIFFSNLERYMRYINPPLCGGDHHNYRSYYFPVKNVIDGDCCEQFYSLELDKQNTIAEGLNTNRYEIANKLQDLREKYAY